MIVRAREFVGAEFSRLSLSIIVFEAAVIFGLVFFYAPVGQLFKEVSWILGSILSVLVGIRVIVWFYREIRNLLAEDPAKEAGQLEETGSTSRSIEDALQTTDERFDEQVSRVTDWINIDENGEITLIPEEDIKDDPKYLLYIIAAKVARELDVRDTARVQYPELSEQVSTTFPVNPFLGKAEQFLNFYYEGESVGSWSDIPPSSRDRVEVEIDIDQIEDAVEWVETGSRNVPRHLESD